MNAATDLAGTSILITDVDRRKALPIIRSLGRAGVHVIGLTHKRMTVGGMSRHCSETIRSPDYEQDPAAFLHLLGEVCRDRQPTVFLPLEDRVIDLCIDNTDTWQPHTKALLPSRNTMDAAYDKWRTLELAEQVGVAIPRSACPGSLSEVEDLAASWEGPAVIKPRRSSGSRGIRYVDDPLMLTAEWSRVHRDFPRPIIQERIPSEGAGLGVFVLVDEAGDLVGLFGHRRLREFPIAGGPSTLRVSHRDDELIGQALRLLDALDFRGVGMVEFKYDSRRKTPILMEVNPRFWGSIQLAISSGVDFPVLYHRAAAGLAVDAVDDYELEVFGRWLLPGDLLHFFANSKRFRMRPSFFRFWGKNLHYDIISVRDPLPMFGIIVEALRRLRGR